MRLAPAICVVVFLTVLVVGAFAALFGVAVRVDVNALWSDTYLRRVVSFTFWQASWSTLLSVGLALPVSRALARRQCFPGRVWLLRLLGLPLVVPSIVAVFGIVAIYGQSGLINRLAGGLGLSPSQYLYGLSGILIAHVFFNLPLAVRLLLPAWQSIPGETWRLAAQLGMRSRDIARLIEWPLLRQVVPAIAALVFMLCFTSFAVVLTLGGGPAATTIEVAIYQALRFDFDLGRAGLLALLQLGCCLAIVAGVQALGKTPEIDHVTGIDQTRPDLGGALARGFDYALLVLVAFSTLLPIGAVVVAGIGGPIHQVLGDAQLWSSAARSLSIALAAGTLAVLASVALLLGSRELRINLHRRRLADITELSASMILVVPPLVLGTGLFIILRPLDRCVRLGRRHWSFWSTP